MMNKPSDGDGSIQRPVHLSEDELSAYINGEINDANALARFEAHLDDCDECRERLNGMRTVVSLLNRSRPPSPSRSFKLDPTMVQPRAVPIEPWILRVQPVMRRLTAIAAVLLLLVVVGDIVAHQGSSGGALSTARDASTTYNMASGGSSSSVASGAIQEATAASGAALTVPEAAQPATASPVSSGKTGSTVPPAARTAVVTESPSGSPTSYWRLLELAVGVVVVWLLFLSVALPRLQSRREPR